MSGESHADRGDRRGLGHPRPTAGGPRQPLDTGRTQPPPAPADPADTVVPGWRGGSSWLHPAKADGEQSSSGPSRPGPSPESVSRGAAPQTSGSVPTGSPGPRPGAEQPSHGRPVPEPHGSVPDPADPTGPDFATQQFPRPVVATPPAGPSASDEPDSLDPDAPTEVFDSAALTRRLAGGPSSWPGHPGNPTARDVMAQGSSGPSASPPRGPLAGGGSGGSGGGAGRLTAVRDRLRDSASARRVLLVAAVVFGVALVGYIADLVMTSGKVPRGVEVAGVAIGGMDQEEARAKLQAALDARAGEVVPVKIADIQTQVVPAAAGLGVDWDATWERVGGQPLNPAARLLSLVADREVAVVTAVDEAELSSTFAELSAYDQPPVEGSVEFRGVQAVAVNPVPGRVLDQPAARTVLTEQWATASTLDLPVATAPPAVRQDAIQQALHQIAEPAVSGPVVYTGKGATEAVLQPEQIAAIVGFVPDGNGGLRVEFDHRAATDLLAPQLTDTEVEPKDATFTFAGTPTVVPAVVGDKINWGRTLEQLPAMLAAAGPQRTTAAIYERIEPKLTTQAAEALGITEVMGEFTTSGFTGPSGVNIRTVAQEVNGAVVKPGDTFSLNGHTGPRGAAEGYVESGIIDHGRPSKAVGGGISQFATTLYNAAYFAGLEDAGHTEHSYYISRYPAAREATVFDGAIDLQFRNNTPHGLYIQALADSSQVTVRIWGTKTVNVESITGEKTKPTEPETITLPEGDDCIPSQGAPGFTISDTRVITDINTGREISRTTRTVKYDPVPEVKCEAPDEEKESDEPTSAPSSGADSGR